MYHVSRLSSGEYGVFADDNGCLLGWDRTKPLARKRMARILKQSRKRARRGK